MSSKPIVLVTGGTGYVGSHVVHQLLEQKKYIVRATARQTNKLFSTFPHAGPDLEVVHVPSLTADHSEVLKGVWALVHCAAPLPGSGTGKVIFDGGYDGAVNVVQGAIKAGVKKIVVTGSMANLFDPDFKAAMSFEPLTENTWGSTTSVNEVDLENPNPLAIYLQAKTLAERKIWELAHQNPDVDVTVLIPSGIFGPFVPNYPPPADKQGLGSMGTIWELITGGPEGPNTYPAFPAGHLIDVRDCAKTHILSLTTPPDVQGKDKRFLTSWNKKFNWKEIVDIVRRERPELATRLPPADAPAPPGINAPMDTSLTERVLGFKKEMYIPMEKTVIDGIDQLVRWEKTLK